MKYGLSEQQYSTITSCFTKFPEVQKVILFGSRAMGNFKPASDLDLLIVGPKVTGTIVTRLYGLLNEETPVPFQFDLLNGNDELLKALQDHIDQYGVVFFSRD